MTRLPAHEITWWSWAQDVNQSYRRLTPNGSDDFFGAMSFAKNNRIIVGEKTEQNAPMTNQQKVDVAFLTIVQGQPTISL